MSKKEELYIADNLDDALENGPIENRGCTDWLFCLLFVAAVIAALAIAFTGFGKGRPELLAVPYDPSGLLL